MKKSFTRQYIHYIHRPVLAFFRMPGSKNFGILLLLFAVILVVAVFSLNWYYINPETGKKLDTPGAVYAVFTLLVFETPLPLPNQWLTRLVFFVVPIAGILVLGQGIIRLGRTLVDKRAFGNWIRV